jgi:hypothetical protein
VRNLVAVVSLTLIASACSGGGSSTATPGPPQAAASQLVQASAEIRAKCRVTADIVEYEVSCPTRVPEGLVATASQGGCQLDIIGPAGQADCAKSWRKWVVGSSETNDQHLVIVASPHALRNYAKVVNGPAWYPGARVRLLQRRRCGLHSG